MSDNTMDDEDLRDAIRELDTNLELRKRLSGWERQFAYGVLFGHSSRRPLSGGQRQIIVGLIEVHLDGQWPEVI